jgi:hypothetical protein
MRNRSTPIKIEKRSLAFEKVRINSNVRGGSGGVAPWVSLLLGHTQVR